MINLYAKYEVSISTSYKDVKGNATSSKCSGLE